MSYIDNVLTHAKNLKLDECEVVFAKRHITTIRITDSQIVEVKQNFDDSIGIRAINEKKIFSAQTNILDDATKTLDKVLQLAEYQKPKQFWKGLPSECKKTPIDGLYDKKLVDITGEQASEIAQTMINSASVPKVGVISGSLNVVSENFELANSNGLVVSDDATYISATINADSEGANPVSGIGQASCRTLDEFDATKVGTDAAQMCIGSINPQKCEQGEYSIILEPYSVGEMLAFVFASNFNFKTFSEKRSCFSDKLNQMIAVEQLSLLDDPHFVQGIGSKSFDDEGVATKQKSLIDNGIFANTFSNLFDAYKENSQSTGNAVRIGSPMGRSSDPIPVSAPHNLRIKEGNMSRDEIISDTKHGILIGRLWYTYAVNPIKGDFSCTARSGVRLIENGKLSPAKSVRIIHNLPVMLQDISAIGNDSKNVLQWASLPSVAPTIRAEKINVTPIN